MIRLQNSRLCIGSAKSDGALALCDDGEHATSNATVEPNGLVTVDAKCLDVEWCGSWMCAAGKVVTYACGSETGHNEHWSFDAARGTIRSLIKSPANMCLAACTNHV
jgi:hypothetical protein